MNKINLLGFNLNQLKYFFSVINKSFFDINYFFKSIHSGNFSYISDISGIDKKILSGISEICTIDLPKVFNEYISLDGSIKWIVELDKNSFIEIVYIPGSSRNTICISSQVGCMMNCIFCATSVSGFNRNLESFEIISQVLFIKKRLFFLYEMGFNKITNVVFMGMGEPLFNFDSLSVSLSILNSLNGYFLSFKKLLVSSSGFIPGLIKLMDYRCSLAISLHAPNDRLRSFLMPINNKYSLDSLMKFCRNYTKFFKKQKITFEYVMINDINDSYMHAFELFVLLKGISCKINLILFNSFDGSEFKCSSFKNIFYFKEILENFGFLVTIRKRRGYDIFASCGQLIGKFVDKTNRRKFFLDKFNFL